MKYLNLFVAPADVESPTNIVLGPFDKPTMDAIKSSIIFYSSGGAATMVALESDNPLTPGEAEAADTTAAAGISGDLDENP